MVDIKRKLHGSFEGKVLGWRQTVGCLGNRAGVCGGGGGAKAALASYFLVFLFSVNPSLPSLTLTLPSLIRMRH